MPIKLYDSPFHVDESPEVSSVMVLKADLLIMLRDIIEVQGWTQAVAADRLGIKQPGVSYIKNGKIDKFALDKLFTMLDSLGFRAKFTHAGEQSTITIQKVEATTA
ncbi:hypothetical protein MNBD_GAMMA10-878 [hydrothermal vent metagenome]|uniref:HTH cro/C1-type domain-containing protein n=1 Tax=hydrothermal vent metagenome TaxID=652676 RepID=A0A3B0XRW5_9ZZZZ